MISFEINENLNIPTDSLVFHPMGYDIIYTNDCYNTNRHCYSFGREEVKGLRVSVKKDMTAKEIVDAAVAGINHFDTSAEFFEILSIEKYCEISGESVEAYQNTIDRAAEYYPKGNLVLVRAGLESWSNPSSKDPAVFVILAVVEADMNIAQIVL